MIKQKVKRIKSDYMSVQQGTTTHPKQPMQISHKSESIRDIRIARHIGQRELAEMADVPITELCKCERGLVIPNNFFSKSVGHLLDVSVQKLLHSHQKLYENHKTGEGYVTNKNPNVLMIPNKNVPEKHTKKVLDLFCGTGGFSHGFEQTKKFTVVAGLDLLVDRAKTFSANHDKAITYCHDITKFSPTDFIIDEIKPDVVIGGPPCQGFSSIRPFRSINNGDSRNNLFEHFAKTVDVLKPQWFVLENVVGLATHQNGNIFSSLLSLFKEIGYTASWKVLNTAHFGVPQRRERLIIVGNRDGKYFEFPEPTHYFEGKSMIKKDHRQNSHKNLKKAITVMDAIGDLPPLEAGEKNTRYVEKAKRSLYAQTLQSHSAKLTLHESTAHSKRLVNIIKHAGPNIHSIPKNLISKGFSTSYSRLEPNEPSVTLTVNFVFAGSNKCVHPFQNRALTPREGARLQGFEDDYVFIGNKNQIVKQIGNAVSPILGRVIAESILKQS